MIVLFLFASRKELNMTAWTPQVELVSITPFAEEVIEEAFRNCWQSEAKKPGEEARRAFLEKCIRRGHLAPVEFASASFRVVASRACTHQVVRHRIASYAQESQRYVRVDNPSYVVPPEIHDNAWALDIFVQAINEAWKAYAQLLDLGVKKQDARFVLPNACKSMIMVSMNFRSWRHFLKLRCDKAAQWELRGIATSMLALLHPLAPGIFGDLYEKFVNSQGKGELWTERD